MNDGMLQGRDDRRQATRMTRAGPALWLHGLHTIGWGFFCLHGVAVLLLLDAPSPLDFLFLLVAIVGGPVVVMLRGLFYCRSRVRWWWAAAAAIAGLAPVAVGEWMWVWSGRARLQNALYLVAPAAYVISWCCVGLLVVSIFDRPWIRRHGLYGPIAAIGALAGGAYGMLNMLVPEVPGPSDYGPFLLSPGIVLEAAICYGLIWIGARRARRRHGKRDTGLPSMSSATPVSEQGLSRMARARHDRLHGMDYGLKG